MHKFLDIALPLEYFQKLNCPTPLGYIKLSKHFYSKWHPVFIFQDPQYNGSWVYYKGIGNNGLPNKCEVLEKNDYREGVDATGNYGVQQYNGTGWEAREAWISGTYCKAFPSNGVTLTGATSIGLRVECTNPDGSKTAYTKMADGPNTDFANSPDFIVTSQY